MKCKSTRGDQSGKINADVSAGEIYRNDVCGRFVTASILGNTYVFCTINYACKRVWCYFCKQIGKDFRFNKHFFEPSAHRP